MRNIIIGRFKSKSLDRITVHLRHWYMIKYNFAQIDNVNYFFHELPIPFYGRLQRCPSQSSRYITRNITQMHKRTHRHGFIPLFNALGLGGR